MKNYFVLFLLSSFLQSQLLAQTENFSLQFDGFDDEVHFPPNQGLLGDNFTVEGWLKCVPSGFPQAVVFGYYDPLTIGEVLGVEVQVSGTLRFKYRPESGNTGGFEVYSNSIVDDGQWHHFACVKEDNRILKIYVDGVLENVTCMVSDNIVQPIFIDFGVNRFAATSNFRRLNGNLDDLKTWTIAKSNREIFAEFKKEHTGTEEGLFNNYKFDVQSDSIFDCSVHKNHGIRVGDSGPNPKPQFSIDFPTLVNAECGFFYVGTNDALLGNGPKIQIFPNPTDQEAVISISNPKKLDAQVFNQAGVLMQQFKIEGGLSKFSTSSLPAGMYELRVVAPEGISVAKFVKI